MVWSSMLQVNAARSVFPQDFPWFSMDFRGFSVDFHGFSMDFRWISVNFQGFPRIFHGVSMDFPQAAKVGTIASKEYPNSACLIMDFQRFSKDFQWIPADSPYISADFPLIFHGFSRILHGFPWIFHRIPRRPLPFLGQDFFPKTRVRNSDSWVKISYLKSS